MHGFLLKQMDLGRTRTAESFTLVKLIYNLVESVWHSVIITKDLTYEGLRTTSMSLMYMYSLICSEQYGYVRFTSSGEFSKAFKLASLAGTNNLFSNFVSVFIDLKGHFF